MSWIPTNMQPNGAPPWPAATSQNPYAPAGSLNGAPANGDGFRANWWGSSLPAEGLGAAGGLGANATLGGAATMISQLLSVVQQYITNLTSMLGGHSSGSSLGGGSAAQPQHGSETFSNATLSSTGDPHLAVSGTQVLANGSSAPVERRFDSMTSHRDLFSTDDFGDAFRVATTVSQPNAKGVTTNAAATASMNGGRDSVSMGAGGAVSVISNGSAVTLAAGQSIALSGGETVRESADGNVTIAEQSGAESLSTTFANNGTGIDVTATASGGVTLGGYLIRHGQAGA